MDFNTEKSPGRKCGKEEMGGEVGRGKKGGRKEGKNKRTNE